MGTKRHLATSVGAALYHCSPGGRVVDLFSGMGSVAEGLAGISPVVTNDALAFTACISRARFTYVARSLDDGQAADALWGHFAAARKVLRGMHSEELLAERTALSGDSADLAGHMQTAKHVGNDLRKRVEAADAHTSTGIVHYRMAALYFAGGYVSLDQAIDADAIRYAIDQHEVAGHRDWFLAAWLSALSTIVNAPGHTAQYLKPNSPAAAARIQRVWSRSMWGEFLKGLHRAAAIGESAWRKSNRVVVSDALDFVGSAQMNDVGVVYADPPYTKDQYSRFYHLFESLYVYDFPDSHGAARSRSDRFSTGFCLKSSVESCFHDLARQVAARGLPLVISYPDNGLLTERGCDVAQIASEYFSDVEQIRINHTHSTLGASKGRSSLEAKENLYVCS